MLKKLQYAILLLVFVFVLTACDLDDYVSTARAPTAVPANRPVSTVQPTDLDNISNIVWMWEGFEDSADQDDIKVEEPDRYTLTLGPDDQALIKADCNQVTAAYTLKDSDISFELGPSTMAFCGEESLDQQYLAMLDQVVTWVLSDDDEFVLNLRVDAGNMIFANGGPADLQAAAEDSVWNRMQESGTILVGTSADYPPFEYYNEDFELEGLDMVIIREIGHRLDLGVEIDDFAFEGLGDALQIGQIDAAIAGISMTSDRMGIVDFSDIYFMSQDATLAHEDSTIAIDDVEDYAEYRVGVQAGSVYENWLRETLVDTGLMRPRKLHVYVETQGMIDDLEEGFIDLVIIDKQPAAIAQEEGPFKIMVEGLRRQVFAIALPTGSRILQAQINRVLDDMKEDGTLFALIEEYMGFELDEILSPGEVLSIPPVDQPCLDGLAWVADLSYDDQNLTTPPPIPPGQPFQKGWRLLNTGTCDWTPNYTFVYASGNVPAARMGGQSTPVQAIVPQGSQYDMWVDLVAPTIPGTYVGYWQMTNADGEPFGQRVWVAISVPAAATATPSATQTPSPEIQFAANPEVIQQGECSTLSWSTSNVQAVYVYDQGEPWQENGVPGTGQRTVCPVTTTSYEMRVLKTDGSVELRQVAVYVTPNVNAPVISRFTAEPSQILEGQCATVQWTVDGQVNRVTLTRNGQVIRDPAPISGSFVDCPPGTGQQTYILSATGSGGTSSAVDYIMILVATETPPTATPTVPAPQPPIVEYFSVNPSQIELGQCVKIAWSVGGGATSVQIKRDNAIILDNAPFRGNTDDCPTTTGAVSYSVIANNNVGDTDSQSQRISVSESLPDNPLLGTSWSLASIDNGVPIPDTTLTAAFSQDTVNGSGGCNAYSASYQVNGENISIGSITSTQLLCDDEVLEQESLYFSALETATSYTLGSQLTISTTAGQMIYNPLAQPR